MEKLNLSREIPLVPEQSALLVVDVQNYCCHVESSCFAVCSGEEQEADYSYYFERLENVMLPNIKRLQQAFRANHMEVLFTTIENLTADGRDRSLDYRISGFNIPKGAWGGQVMDEVKPAGDEIRLSKTSSSVFISTNIDYLLRNMGIRQLVICGVLTDQCVESAVRDACDLGYLVTVVSDGCATHTQKRHDNSLKAISGYCRQCTTAQVLEELS